MRTGGKSFGFFSAKGGCGATTLACHVAVELGRQGQRVLLADLDLDAGMVAFLIKTKSPYSMLDAVNNLHRLDVSYWKALVSNGIPNVEIISAPAALAAKQQRPGRTSCGTCWASCARSTTGTVVDLGRSLSRLTHGRARRDRRGLPGDHARGARAAPGQADRADAARQRLRQEPPAADPEPRAQARGYHRRKNWRRCWACRCIAMLPDDYPELYECYSEGKLLPRNSDLARHIARVARQAGRGSRRSTARRSKRLFALFRIERR